MCVCVCVCVCACLTWSAVRIPNADERFPYPCGTTFVAQNIEPNAAGIHLVLLAGHALDGVGEPQPPGDNTAG
jgi:hypothetical protein